MSNVNSPFFAGQVGSSPPSSRILRLALANRRLPTSDAAVIARPCDGLIPKFGGQAVMSQSFCGGPNGATDFITTFYAKLCYRPKSQHLNFKVFGYFRPLGRPSDWKPEAVHPILPGLVQPKNPAQLGTLEIRSAGRAGSEKGNVINPKP